MSQETWRHGICTKTSNWLLPTLRKCTVQNTHQHFFIFHHWDFDFQKPCYYLKERPQRTYHPGKAGGEFNQADMCTMTWSTVHQQTSQ